MSGEIRIDIIPYNENAQKDAWTILLPRSLLLDLGALWIAAAAIENPGGMLRDGRTLTCKEDIAVTAHDLAAAVLAEGARRRGE